MVLFLLLLLLLVFFNTPSFSLPTFYDLTNNSDHITTFNSTPDLIRSISNIPLHAVYQCNDHLSSIDCLACFEAAIAQARNCSPGYDGFASLVDCFLGYERTNLVNADGDGIPNLLPITADISNTKQTMDRYNPLGDRRFMREVGGRAPSPPAGDFGQGSPNWNFTHNATTQQP